MKTTIKREDMEYLFQMMVDTLGNVCTFPDDPAWDNHKSAKAKLHEINRMVKLAYQRCGVTNED